MENNKSEFKATGVYFDGARVYEIQISKNILTWQQKTINLSICYSAGFNAIAITILVMAAEMLNTAFGHKMSRNKSIKCESYTICCRLNLSGLQENRLMNTPQKWA